jgi:hypothetical protein
MHRRTSVWHLESLDGATHFLTKTLPKVRTEMRLHVLAYNMKRMMQIMGIQRLITAMTGEAVLKSTPGITASGARASLRIR